jgi:hypothetical protein
MVGDDLDLGMPVEEPVEDQPGHGYTGLVGPAKSPPDLVLRFSLGVVVGEASPARGVQQDGEVILRHGLEERTKLGRVQRFAGSVAKNLNASRAKLSDRAVELDQRRFRVVHGQRSGEGGKSVRVAFDELRHTVVCRPGQLDGDRRAGQGFDGRRGQAQDLMVVVEAVHDPEALVEVHQHGNAANALSHVFVIGGHFEHQLVVRLRKDVVEDVDFPHGCLFPWDSISSYSTAGAVAPLAASCVRPACPLSFS